jgi:hypothetical protein
MIKLYYACYENRIIKAIKTAKIEREEESNNGG